MRTKRTTSGIYFRRGELVSAAFSPYTGSVFAVDPQFNSVLNEWLDCRPAEVPPEIATVLGAGWAPGSGRNSRPTRHILPDEGWGFSNALDRPLVINWLLTGNCAYECPYCYAQDLMNGRCREPKEADVKRIAKEILSFDPVAVVLTGGDPLLSPHLRYAIELLHEKAGVIVDTSGFGINDKQIESFRDHRVFVRISLDSELGKKSSELRPMKARRDTDTGDIALQSIQKCMSHDVNLGVQTVITAVNYGDLESLGIKLHKLGVCYWRIMLLAHTAETDKVFQKLRFTDTNDTRFRKNIYPKLKGLFDSSKDAAVLVQLAENDVPNAVILVSPDGVFYTESATGNGKRVIDPSNRTKPTEAAMRTNVDMYAHARRYLCE